MKLAIQLLQSGANIKKESEEIVNLDEGVPDEGELEFGKLKMQTKNITFSSKLAPFYIFGKLSIESKITKLESSWIERCCNGHFSCNSNGTYHVGFRSIPNYRYTHIIWPIWVWYGSYESYYIIARPTFKPFYEMNNLAYWKVLLIDIKGK